ncbi:hypothetical protein P4U05_16645 [Bacillus paranthracis]|uniref:hypothetical protein n=1 Tax=Bacillus cereus group TaxID=86661 RepID=UPI000200F5ED|nr:MULTISPECIES: hypothetical protein [Bacillus cereus group]ADY20421.1 hypothetical protein YBT020_05875 [Bacillus thuringiensis serovar finitimus YBT-020]MRC72900.1 hypothetical protein [Bacillus thuringiensis]OTX71359.1 hypothetical protein BK722_13195 [Bacillus thuringiensis serovar finitimus]MCR6799308.1 hypothetical protein [Bacillus paranthracis]MEC3358533.1 hypothetical protein [Bacillus paranthracis]
MDKSKKKRFIILIILAIIFLAIGCTASFIHNRNITKEKATEVAIQHMKKEENIDFVVTDVKIEHLELAGFITVSGYDKNNKQERYHVMINKTQNYTIEFWGKIKS